MQDVVEVVPEIERTGEPRGGGDEKSGASGDARDDEEKRNGRKPDEPPERMKAIAKIKRGGGGEIGRGDGGTRRVSGTCGSCGGCGIFWHAEFSWEFSARGGE